jgi:hypothetical protein
MLINIGIGSVMMIITTAIHMTGMVITMRVLERREHRKNRDSGRTGVNNLYFVGAAAWLMFVASLLEVAAWAGTYVFLGAIEGAEPALYFSTVTFTTLGYGDVLLDERWRLLGSSEAANGIIMFGWTTAVVVAVVQRVYSTKSTSHQHSN